MVILFATSRPIWRDVATTVMYTEIILNIQYEVSCVLVIMKSDADIY